MIPHFSQKIHDLRREPESVRLQAAIRYTVIVGVVIAILWLVIFLPLQLTL